MLSGLRTLVPILLLAALPTSSRAADEGEPSDPVLHRVHPVIPAGVERYEHTRQARCEVSFRIDRRGEPKHVEVDGCVPCYALASSEAAWQWRFEPGTKRHRTHFVYKVEVTEAESSEPVVEHDQASEELTVSISLPVLNLDLRLDTQVDDSVPLRPIGETEIRRRTNPHLDAIDIEPVRRLQAWYGLSRISCELVVLVNEQGEVEGWHPTACSAHFHETVANTLEGWRWKPWMVDGEPQAFAVELSFLFDFVD